MHFYYPGPLPGCRVRRCHQYVYIWRFHITTTNSLYASLHHTRVWPHLHSTDSLCGDKLIQTTTASEAARSALLPTLLACVLSCKLTGLSKSTHQPRPIQLMTMTQIALAIVGAVDLVLTGAFVALLRQNRTGFVGYVVLTYITMFPCPRWGHRS